MINVKIKVVKSVKSVLQALYGDKLQAGWINPKPRKFVSIAKKVPRIKNRIRPTRLSAKETTLEVVESLEEGGRPVFSEPAYDKDKVRRVLNFFAMYGSKDPKYKKRVLNMARSLFKTPMLKGRYKKESPRYLEQKGFSRPSYLSGQTADAISARFVKWGEKDDSTSGSD